MLPFRYIAESIPWLVANKRYEEAEKILRKAAKLNKISLPENIFERDSELPLMQGEENKDKIGQTDGWHDDLAPLAVAESVGSLADALPSKLDNSQQGALDKDASDKTYNVCDIMRSKLLCLYTCILICVW